MSNIICCSLNVRGLNVPQKRTKVIYDMHKQGVQILFLQETHFKDEQAPIMPDRHFGMWFMSNNPLRKARGVAIGIHSRLLITETQCLRDEEGRFIFLKCKIQQKQVTLVNLYLPNGGQIQTLRLIFSRLEEFKEGVVIMGGDFNLVWDPEADATTSTQRISERGVKRLRRLFYQHQLVDIWRLLHPEDRDYTCHSTSYSTYSRIDFFMVSHCILDWSPKASIGVQLWSDHSPIFLTISLPGTIRSGSSWRLNETLLTDRDVQEDLKRVIDNFLKDHEMDATPCPIKWEALKCVVRGTLISHGTRIKKERSRVIVKLTQEIQALEMEHKRTNEPSCLQTLQIKRGELLSLMDHSYQKYKDCLRHCLYVHGNKCGKALARSIRAKHSRTFISKMKCTSRGMVHSPIQIATVFQEYYTKLYNIRDTVGRRAPDGAIETLNEYVNRTGLPLLEPAVSAGLNNPFTQEEVLAALSSMPNGKSPGPDGYTAYFYKQLKESLVPIICSVYNAVTKTCPFTRQTQEAHVTVILKENKDPTVCTSYRPISLINLDLKIYAKIIANRIKSIIPSIIHLEQTGFVPGREARDNTTRAITLMSYARRRRIPLCLLALDAEKAFDRLDWDFLFATLEQLGLPSFIIDKIQALYEGPTARIKVNGILSERVNIGNGTRQGCPLSPLLYVLAMEHLAISLRNNPSIQGLEIGGVHHKLSLFADDVLIYITNPRIALPSILEEIEIFGLYSNFKVNVSKSVFLNVSLPKEELEGLQTAFPFKWVSESLKYLGVQIPANLDQMYNLNYIPLLTSTQKRLQGWSSRRHTWFGRMALFKMDILPRFLYLFQTLPIEIPMSYFNRVKTLLIRYVWANAPARIRYELLTWPKERGGAGLPNLYLYYLSTVIGRMVNWYRHKRTKLWAILEQDLTQVPLVALPWISRENRPPMQELPPLVRRVLEVWDLAIQKYGISSRVGPMTPVMGNPDFPPGIGSREFLCWTHGKPSPIFMGLDEQGIKPRVELIRQEERKRGNWLEYFQLRDFYSRLSRGGQLIRPLTEIEKLCMENKSKDHLIAQIYNIFMAQTSRTCPYYVREWEKELGYELEASEWDKSFILTHKSNVDSQTQERNYKILTRWYRCPDRISKYAPSVPAVCWRCGRAQGTMLHIWWQCHGVRRFWGDIFEINKGITGVELPEVPEVALLSVVPGSQKGYRKGLSRFLMAAGRAVIPRLWKTTQTPTIKEWINEVNNILRMEELMLRINEPSYDLEALWGGWREFVKSPDARDYIENKR